MNNNKQNKLTKKEQTTTATYKLMSEKINYLEESLEKTQNESEIIREEKHNLDKELAITKSKLEKNNYLEILKFFSSAGVGLSINYLTGGSYSLCMLIGIPCLIIYAACLLLDTK
jgi:hypothetical protein